MFSALPTISSIIISTLNWDYESTPVFVGLGNFIKLFNLDLITTREFYNAVKGTLIFVAGSVPLLVVIPFLIALLLNTKIPLRKFFRGVLYFPTVLSVATVSIIWIFLLDTNMGLINELLNQYIPWITKQPWAWLSIIIMSVWWGIGGNMVLFLAGLQDVPANLLEAASIDGANSFQKFIYVTIPSLKRTLGYVIVMTIISSFNIFGQPMMLTGGGPNYSTTTAIMYIYNTAFGSYRMGMASAMSILLGLIMMVFSFISFRLISGKGEE
jgi:multiple sugar transport system permease protein